jgi:outer membrane protein OmpA-like peptidoglycan-associated protein
MDSVSTMRLRFVFRRLAIALVLVLVMGACGDDDDASDDASATTEAVETTETDSTEPEGEPTSTLPAGQRPGYDDLNQDGELDPICATNDYGEGLVLQVPCNAGDYAPTPREGTTPVDGSLLRLPALVQRELLGGCTCDGVQGRDPSGKLVVVFLIQADVAFEVGSSQLSEAAQASISGLASAIQSAYPTAAIQVRGHTDATGSASANQQLSLARANSVADYLGSQGIDRSRISTVGMASTRPVVLETNPDGSDNPAGRTENRRVELVVRTP